MESTSASVIIVGMRGSGKTTIGGLAARALDWTFFDADFVFEEKHQIGVREFVHQHGWPAFRDAEAAVLKDLLEKHPTNHVISLGGGIVETPAARDLLKNHGKKGGPVVHIVREIDEVVKYLGEETARPAYGEPVVDVFRRREPWYAECSTYDFVNFTGALQHSGALAAQQDSLSNTGHLPEFASLKFSGFQSEVDRFFGHITGVKSNAPKNLVRGKRSYFLSLTYPDITPALPHIDELTAGADAIELRVDLLRSPKDTDVKGSYIPPTSYVVSQLAALRQRSSLPVVFCVRTVSQGGSHPDDAEEEAFTLYEIAVRNGCEFIDVELAWKVEKIRAFAQQKAHSQIIASWHDWSGNMKWDGKEVKDKYELGSELGDVVKIVGKATSLADNLALQSFVATVTNRSTSKPLVAINTGYEGQLSRILNSTLSPVTHPLLAVKAAPGQLSVAQIQTALSLIGQLPAKRYFLFGTPISASPSPTLHNTGFELLGLPHKYDLFETAEVDDSIKELVRAPDFGGASVTIPHKLAVIPLLDQLTEHAKAIGAVNTVISQIAPDGSKILLGDNTDWLGIRNTIKASFSSEDRTPTTGLVIGAGGTSRAALYALHSLGLKQIYLYNRTRESALKLAMSFPGNNITTISNLEAFPNDPPSIIVSTVPASATSMSSDASASLKLTSGLFKAGSGVVVDMAYRPLQTPLLTLASQEKGWQVVSGIDVLLEQGFAQFVAWTGRHVPRRHVAEKVWEKYTAV